MGNPQMGMGLPTKMDDLGVPPCQETSGQMYLKVVVAQTKIMANCVMPSLENPKGARRS